MKKTLLFSSGLIAVLGGAYISPMGQVGMNQAYAADSIKNSYLNNNFYKPNSGHYGQVQLADQSVGAEENASEWGKSRAIKESKRKDANKEYNNGRLLSDKNRDGQFTVKADVGYFYNFANQWNSGAGKVKVNGSSAVGYGASVGYTHKSGLGLSADYLGSNNKFNTAGRNYDASLHTIALTPSYRFSLDKNDEWGLRVGLGMGLSISNVAWGAGPAIASGVVGGSAVHPTGKGSSIPADSRPVKNNAGNSGAGNGKSAGGAYYTKYTDAQDKTFAVSACNNEPATRVYDSSGYLLAGHNRCANGATRVAATNDNRIVQWLVNDSTARLGSAEHPNGGGHVAANVWLRLLKAADGDPEALASLASTANPRPTDSQARDALIRLMGGYDGKHAPAGYSAGGTYETKRKAAELGVSPSQLENLTKAGIVFKDAPVPLTEIAGATPVQPLPTPPATGGAPFKATGLTPADPATGGAPFKATGLTPADPATGGAPFKAMGLTPADPATGGAPFKATDLIPSKEWEKPFKATVINPSQELTGGQPFKATKLNPTNEVTGGAPFTSTKLTPAHGATGGAPFKATALMPSQEVTGGTPFKATELNPSQKRAGEPDKNGETAGKPTGNEPSRPITPERPTPTEITAYRPLQPSRPITPERPTPSTPDKNGETAGKPTGNEPSRPSRPSTPEMPTPKDWTEINPSTPGGPSLDIDPLLNPSGKGTEKTPPDRQPSKTQPEIVAADMGAGKSKADVGFVLIPQVALEYKTGMFHGDLSIRYLQAMKDVKYNGVGGAAGETYIASAGPLGLFVGLGVGINF